MVNLFTTYYTDEARRDELYHVHLLNKSNKSIDMVYILNENEIAPDIGMRENNIVMKQISSRPTFQSIFNWVNEVTGEQDINIIANSDIYFVPDAIEYMKLLLGCGDCWALTRWDATTGVFMNRRDSQDSFCFRGAVKAGEYGFGIGVPGCDNALCERLQRAGYNITNPSWTVKTYHLHAGEDRKWHGMARVEPPYLLIEPEELI